MRYLIKRDGRAVESRGTKKDALAFRSRCVKAAKIAAKSTKVDVAAYNWKVIDTQTGEEVV